MKNKQYGLSTFIGETIQGLPYPIFFDPHYCILHNKPPVTLITGSPGSGKTFFGLILASHSSILGKLGVILDHKGDFITLNKMYREKKINKVQIWSVVNTQGEVNEDSVGMLDPTNFYNEPSSNTALTIDIIKLLVGELTHKQKTELVPIVKDVVESSNCTFSKVVQKLLRSQEDEILSLGHILSTLLELPLSKLLTSGKKKKTQVKYFDMNDGTIVINLMGLTLPSETTNVDDYSAKEKISVCIMGLLTSLIVSVMEEKPKNIFKTLIIDEAWAMMATKTGRNMISKISLLGRSLNMATILLTQSPSHIEVDDGPELDTTISSRFAFRNDNAKDNLKTISAMKLLSEEGWQDLLPELNVGECLMQDSVGNKSFIQILAQDDWIDTFDTNPLSEI